MVNGLPAICNIYIYNNQIIIKNIFRADSGFPQP